MEKGSRDGLQCSHSVCGEEHSVSGHGLPSIAPVVAGMPVQPRVNAPLIGVDLVLVSCVPPLPVAWPQTGAFFLLWAGQPWQSTHTLDLCGGESANVVI